MKKIIGIVCLLVSASASADESNYYWKKCNNRHASGTTIPFSGTLKHHKFLPKCAPDVLYSWHNFDKNEYPDIFEKFSHDPFSGFKSIYAWRTPIGTFGYGTTQIRMKLRDGVQFKWVNSVRSCSFFPAEEHINTVYVTLPGIDGASDYKLCSSSVVESWSKNTDGAAMEAKKEFEYIKKNYNEKIQTYDGYGRFNKYRERVSTPFVRNNPYFDLIFDTNNDWSFERLIFNIERLSQNNEPGDGQVFYSRGAIQDPQRHFSSKVFSPFSLSDEETQKAASSLSTP